MPTTTSITRPSLLDLLPPPQTATPGGKETTAFDALLQPPAARETPRDDRPCANDNAPRHGSHEAGDSPRVPAPPQLPHDKADAPTNAATQETAKPDLAASSAGKPADTDQSHETETDVVAESVAAMTVCVLPIPQTVDAPSDDTSPTVSIKPSTGKRGNRTPSTNGASAGENRTAASADAAESGTPLLAGPEDEVPGEANLSATQVRGKQPEQTQVMQNAETHGVVLADAATNGGGETSIAEALTTSSEASAESAGHHHSDAKSENASSPSIQPTDAAPPVAPATTSLDTPSAGAVAPQLPVAPEPAGAPASSTASTTVEIAGAGRRARLSAEILTQDAGRPARAAPSIDTTRLLTRVARAFATAQQRDGEIQLRLSPPELGSLKLTVHMQDGGLVARLETETSSAKTALIDNLPALRERLAEQGVQIERFDVDLMQRQPGGMPDRPGDQQREAPPSRATTTLRTRTEPSPTPRPASAAIGSASGLNVIV